MSKVDFIMGPTNTPQAMAVANITYELKVPQISNASIGIPGEKGEWLVSVPTPAEAWIAPVVKDMKKRGVKRVAFIGFSDPWGDLCYEGIKTDTANSGIEVVANERHARTDTSVNGQEGPQIAGVKARRHFRRRLWHAGGAASSGAGGIVDLRGRQ